MAGYILVDIKTKKIVGTCAIFAIILFIIGILIGFFSGRPSDDVSKVTSPPDSKALKIGSINCYKELSSGRASEIYYSRYLERHGAKNTCPNDVNECLTHNMPRHYIAYHLNGKEIKMDGKLDDDAWTEVPWTEDFVDMRSESYGKPRLRTKVKVRWDNERLYIGAWIQETNLWATLVKHDSNVWTDNSFEVLMDVEGSMFYYKQAQINVLGTMLDLMYNKSPYNNGSHEISWHPDVRKGIYMEGTVNNASDTDKYWSVEMSFSFKALRKTWIRKGRPDNDEVWFMQFGRSEQPLNVTADGKYEKGPDSNTEWWSWQPCDTINLHLQDRWGLVQFKRSMDDEPFKFEKWHIYRALFDTMDALNVYKAVNGQFTNQIEELDVPPYLFARKCVEIPEIRIKNGTEFEVTVRSAIFKLKPGHIRSDRWVTFY